MKKRMKKLLSLFLVLTFLSGLSTVFAATSEAATVKIYGIDVSKYQPTVDWAKVKASGVDFVIIRAGYSGVKDPCFESHYAGAKSVGLNVGAYIYSYADSAAGARADAENMKNWLAGKTFEYPIYFDIEDTKQKNLPTVAARMELITVFCAEMEAAGFYAGVYTGRSMLNSLLDPDAIRANYPLWQAQYLNSGTDSYDRSNECGIWQYSSSGSVPGISGNVDMNVSYVDYPAIIKSRGYNGFTGEDIPVVDRTRGYYVTTGNLNMRGGPGTSYGVIEVLQKGTEVALLSTNDAKTWANVIHGDNLGWASLSYLNFVRNFDYELSYEMNMPSAAKIPQTKIELGSKTVVEGKGLVSGGYALSGWYLKRSSDGAWLTSDGQWKADAADSEKVLYVPDSLLILDDSLINLNAGDDSYVLSGVWVKMFEEPDTPAPGRGYYEVATSSSNLSMRSGPGTNYDIIASIPKGTTVAIIGTDEDASWANAIYDGKTGWLSMGYLRFIREFRYTFSYDMAMPSVSGIDSAVLSYGDTLTVEGEGLTANGYMLEGWSLQRASDGAWFTSEGWQTNMVAEAVLFPGDKLTVNAYLTNYYAGDETFILSAIWTESAEKELPLIGDCDGNGTVDAKDLRLMKMYIGGEAVYESIVLENTDMNSDGKINAVDYRILLSYFLT